MEKNKIYPKICIVCGKSYMTVLARKKTSKYCSITCMGQDQKGKKRPHSKEWEENRLKAIRENSWKLKGRISPKSKETIKIAFIVGGTGAKIKEDKRYRKK